MAGGDDTDYMLGQAGTDVIYGNKGADIISGGAGADSIYGGQGDDQIYADGTSITDTSADLLYGNLGNDTLVGSYGDDIIYGGQDDDTISGSRGNDILYGNLGDDTLNGAIAGSDASVNDADTLYGGAGLDTFVVDGDQQNYAEIDVIGDFEISEFIDVSGAFASGVSGSTNYMRLVDDGDDLLLQIDPDTAGDTYDYSDAVRLIGIQDIGLSDINFIF
jgi:Ca2+-binding RTX toxin-like protein